MAVTTTLDEDVRDTSETPQTAPATRPGHGLAVVAGLTALVGGLPTIVALAALSQPRWYPALDLAQTELRLRDFTNGHVPLIGLPGRLEAFGKRGSHLGPLEFWAMWPFYKLYGSSAWAVQAAGATVNLVATGVAIWIGWRRAQLLGALGVALLLAVLGHAYGAEVLVSEHWIPHTPLMWWVVFLLAAWSVLCDDLALLPVAVFAGSFCVQTHIPYLGLVVGVGALLVAVVGVAAVRRRSDPSDRRRVLRWCGGSALLAVLLWLPPLIDQLTTDPGNVTIMRLEMTEADEPAVGVGELSFGTWLGHMDVWKLLTGDQHAHKNDDKWAYGFVPGLLLIAAWLGAALLALRRRQATLIRLHALVGVASFLGLVSIVRVTGILWYYLVLWAWGTTALMLGVTLWTFASAWPRDRWRLPAAAPAIALLTATAVMSIAYAQRAVDTEVSDPRASTVLSHLAPATIERLDEGGVPGTGRDGRYMIDFASDDAAGLGEQGFGMLLELERAGFDVGVPGWNPGVVTGAVPHRVRKIEDTTAVIHYVVGEANIERWRSVAPEIAYYDLRTPAERRRYEQLLEQALDDLYDAGLDDLAEGLPRSLIATSFDPRLPRSVVAKVHEMAEIGLPAAVFVTSPDALPST